MATTGGHTVKAFDEDLAQLRALISQMGGFAEHALDEAMRCLVQRDREGALRTISATIRPISGSSESGRKFGLSSIAGTRLAMFLA